MTPEHAKSEPGPPSRVGQQIGRYRVVEAIGAGGMGEVYRAQDPRLDRSVAIKILPPALADDPVALSRFRREAKAVAALSHPNILALHDFDSDGSTHFAVMELLDGETLSQRLSRNAMAWEEAVAVAIAVAEGLAAAHKKGIIHRDIKPDNIFVTRDGQVKMLDFGVARVATDVCADTQTQVTQPGFAIGTIGYMAPEQLRGETASPPADLFSLGCVLYEMITGRKAFSRQNAADTVAAILTSEPAPMADWMAGVPSELDAVVQRCLRKMPADRFQTADELAMNLRQIRDGRLRTAPEGHTLSRLGTAAWIAVVAIMIAGAAAVVGKLGWSPAEYEESLAILPLANQSGDPELDYVSDGITEALINKMSQVRQLKVIARTTAFQYKGRSIDPQAVGRRLKVRRVFTGVLVRTAGNLGVQVDLINVADGAELWGGHYSEQPSSLLDWPETMSAKISENLRLRLNADERKRLSRRQTQNQEAYRLYLLGRYALVRRDWNDPDAVKRALDYFQRAIDQDPLYALAYVGLAETYNVLPQYSSAPAAESRAKAKAAVARALEIDDTVAEGYATLADLAADEWNWVAADDAFRRALALSPGYAVAHQWYAENLDRMGRGDEALGEIRRACELDPLSPAAATSWGAILTDNHRYEQAIEQFRKAMELNPRSAVALVHIAVALLAEKKFAEGLAELDRADALMTGTRVVAALRGYAYAQTGKRQAALDILRKITEPKKPGSASGFATGFDLPILYLGLKDLDRTFDALNESIDQRARLIDHLKVDPLFEPVRSDPRYAALLRRMNLKP